MDVLLGRRSSPEANYDERRVLVPTKCPRRARAAGYVCRYKRVLAYTLAQTRVSSNTATTGPRQVRTHPTPHRTDPSNTTPSGRVTRSWEDRSLMSDAARCCPPRCVLVPLV